ncbi:hypothetical protein A2276_06820 [candidate division WOR-1 bacterium RIFOXYA12_FULL_43_27]|uniref:Probable molybdenum cofactor guanylyltransferase n=1 Tax=candidate division WOR-1 bacterium RIFOXYC2_FULL_46_14 TaxID=1802587 RepID=A0A1F4U5F6_UNCSA|nr:MAG: hypothetical protein A2276_06820 [candidate division WOR-1 bacterium RIFOXYA12_FULL_43_27]OGC20359.1 MAG: hypothetical protein A2292_04820 [candidate division WOR-1 bacterium RIFOXYB2_FULL_46_45]OGC31904.1 MAG: hypothetical protein A2232_06630 [candidate division WOR-1 bacterium RIFOXYA2_FULL_46_56]OGC40205.1 MAG: hypothetical protein A2438_02840 [candidate division WOR-1 bacterium RIFOXYC2_FULL_46_14]
MNGIILAGGKSLRFGEDKAFVKIGEGEDLYPRFLIEIIIGLLARLFDKVIIVTNYPEKYKNYPVEIVVDRIRGVGPLGGIHAGLLASDTEHNFIMACDMPFPQAELVRFLGSRAKNQDLIIPKRGEGFEPLFSVYSKNCIAAIERQIKTGNYKIQEMFSGLDVEFVEEEDLRRFDPALISFLNLNTKKDLERIYECLKKQKLSALV